MIHSFQDYSSFDLYVAGFYFVTATLTTVGYGDVSSYNMYEQLISIVVLLIGVAVFSFSIGNLTALMSSADDMSGNY